MSAVFDQGGEYWSEGWEQREFSSSRKFIDTLVVEKDRYLREVAVAVGPSLGVSFGTYDPAQKVELEVLKAIVRGLLRYDPDARRLAASNAVAMRSYAPETTKYFATMVYPLIHVPLDGSEQGDFHTDRLDFAGDLHTLWTPLNDCDAGPVTILPKSHHPFRHIAYRVRYNHRFIERVGKTVPRNATTPRVRVGQSLAWTAKTYHRGNLNQSGKVTVALVIRVTELPLMFEPTRSVSECVTFNTTDDRVDASAFALEFLSVYQSIMDIAKHASSISNWMREIRHCSSSWGLSDKNKARASFGLTLIAQRLSGDFATVCDLASLIIAHDNLVSLERVLAKIAADPLDLKTFLTEYRALYDTAQVNFIVDRHLAAISSWQSKRLFQWT